MPKPYPKEFSHDPCDGVPHEARAYELIEASLIAG